MASGGKIKNWSPKGKQYTALESGNQVVYRTNVEKVWKNDVVDRIIAVQYEPDFKGYGVYVLEKASGGALGTAQGYVFVEEVAPAVYDFYGTKKRAMKEAAKWMRDHPLAGRDPDEVRQEMDL